MFRFKEGWNALLRLVQEAAETTRLSDEMSRQEVKLASLVVSQREAMVVVERIERAIIDGTHALPERQHELHSAQSRLAHLEMEYARSQARLVVAERQYRAVTGSPMGALFLRVTRRRGQREDHFVERMEGWLSVIELLAPPRLRQEEIGDAREIIHHLSAEALPGWQRRVRVKVISTTFWVLVNALREVAAGIFGKKSA